MNINITAGSSGENLKCFKVYIQEKCLKINVFG